MNKDPTHSNTSSEPKREEEKTVRQLNLLEMIERQGCFTHGFFITWFQDVFFVLENWFEHTVFSFRLWRYLVYTGDLFNWKWRSTQRQELAKQQRLQHFNFRFSWQCHIHASWYYSMSSTDKYIRDMTNEIIGTWLWLRRCDEIRWYRMFGAEQNAQNQLPNQINWREIERMSEKPNEISMKSILFKRHRNKTIENNLCCVG